MNKPVYLFRNGVTNIVLLPNEWWRPGKVLFKFQFSGRPVKLQKAMLRFYNAERYRPPNAAISLNKDPYCFSLSEPKSGGHVTNLPIRC